MLAVLLAFTALAPAALAAKPRKGAVAAKPSKPRAVGADDSATLEAKAAVGDRAPFGVALFERRDIPVYEPGTVAECFAYGPMKELAQTDLSQFSMTCRPEDPRGLEVNAAVYDPGRTLTPARYEQLRRDGERLPGTTLVAGRAGRGVKAVKIDGPGKSVVVRTARTGGAFLTLWDGWLEDTTIRVTARGARWSHKVVVHDASLFTDGWGHRVVLPPLIETRLLSGAR